MFALGMAFYWSFFSYAVFPVGGVDQALVDRSSVIARSLLLALFGIVLSLGAPQLARTAPRIRALKAVLAGACAVMLAASFAPAAAGAGTLAFDIVSALHIALLTFCWAWASDKIEGRRFGGLLSAALIGAIVVALLARVVSDAFPVSEPAISTLLPALSTVFFLAVPSRPTAPSAPMPSPARVFDGSLGIMLVTLVLYDLGSAVFRNVYVQAGIAYESIHATAASWLISCAIAAATVGCVYQLEKRGRAEGAWIALALACLVSLYLIALFGSILPSVCNDLVLATRFFVMAATWTVAVATAHARQLPSAALATAIFLPLVAVSRIIIYGPWQLSHLGGASSSAVFLASVLATALFLTLLVVGYATKPLRQRAAAEGAAPGGLERQLERDLREEFGLTQREYEVLELLSRGYSQKKVAELLVLSVSSVQSYSKTVYRKLGVHSKQEVIDLVDGRRAQLGLNQDR